MRPCNQCRQPVENNVTICDQCKQWNESQREVEPTANTTQRRVESESDMELFSDYSYAILMGTFSLVITALFGLIGLVIYGLDGFLVGGAIGLLTGVTLFTISIKM